MSHQASSAGLSYQGTHHFRDWFDNNVSVKGLVFAVCFLCLFLQWMCICPIPHQTGAAIFQSSIIHACNVNSLTYSHRAFMPASICVVLIPPSLPALSSLESCSINNCKWIMPQLEFRSRFNKSIIQSATGSRRHFVCVVVFTDVCECT